jgi:putative transposase
VRSEFRKISLRQACLIFNLSTSVYRYTAKKKQDDEVIHQELISLAEKRPTWGFWKMYHRIRLDGWRINHKRVYRLYLEARLNMRRKTRKRVAKRIKQPLLQPLQPNLSWSTEFMENSTIRKSVMSFPPFNRITSTIQKETLFLKVAK